MKGLATLFSQDYRAAYYLRFDSREAREMFSKTSAPGKNSRTRRRTGPKGISRSNIRTSELRGFDTPWLPVAWRFWYKNRRFLELVFLPRFFRKRTFKVTVLLEPSNFFLFLMLIDSHRFLRATLFMDFFTGIFFQHKKETLRKTTFEFLTFESSRFWRDMNQ